MKRIAVLIGTIIFSVLVAALYGALHDQVTYTLSPEYFTKFKYEQFGLEPSWFGGDRPTVAVVGVFATWWTGLIIGVALGWLGLLFSDHKIMCRVIGRALALTICIAILAGVLGFWCGRLTSIPDMVLIPGNVVDKKAFFIVGCIHTFSYMGGLVGVLAGVFYMLIIKARKDKRQVAV